MSERHDHGALLVAGAESAAEGRAEDLPLVAAVIAPLPLHHGLAPNLRQRGADFILRDRILIYIYLLYIVNIQQSDVKPPGKRFNYLYINFLPAAPAGV